MEEVKAEIGRYVRRHADDPGRLFDADVVVSELLSNAVRHAAGPAWVSIVWTTPRPVLSVYDLGPGFVFDPKLPDDPLAEGGRGLYIVSHMVDELDAASRRAGGTRVEAVLPVTRQSSDTYDPPRRRSGALPHPDEAQPGGGFGKESFLRALVVQLAQAIEADHGPAAAEAAVAQVAADVGGRMEDEYRAAKDIAGRMTPGQMADCYVRLKHAIDGGFYVIEATEGRIVLGNTACPFGSVVTRAPALCRMTSSVFGGIAARNSEKEASVVLEERIAVGDPGCRVVVYLDRPPDDPGIAHHYATPVDELEPEPEATR
ncbi:MAG TPA: methanogen output domain 1-containing protein [Actinomycetota bacterium]|nr:methanogen output domain 1-containing protein [Actinomycetota bacterium]